MKQAIIVFSDGFEEIETIVPIDILRRAGIDVLTVGLTGTVLTGAHGIVVQADKSFADYSYTGQEAAFVLPGGGANARSLSESTALCSTLSNAAKDGHLIAAICASAALVLDKADLLSGKSYTCYPGTEQQVSSEGKHCAGEPVVLDGNIITGRGPGVAVDFSLAVVEYLVGKEIAEEIATAMCC